MKKRLQLMLSLAFMLAIPLHLFAQERVITGTVNATDEDLPLPGVSIIKKGTNEGTTTDVNGRFSLMVDASDVLVFSYVGYNTLEREVGSMTKMDIELEPDLKALEEVVVIGYGTQKKKELTGAVGNIKGEEMQKFASAKFVDALQGQLAGVNVQASSGQPGSEANIQIRGLGSLSSGASGPLFVVDGVPLEGQPNLSSNEIESVDVLKDAASASIYGTRASNGVILITTKRGKAGTMKVNLNAYYGVQKITSNLPLANTPDALYINYLEQISKGETNIWNPLDQNPNGLYYDTDWVGDLTVDNAPIQNYNLGVSGGKEDLTYNVTADYFSQDGSVVNSLFDRFSLRGNTTFKKKRFSMNTNLGINITNKDNAPWGIYESAIKLPPYQKGLGDDNILLVEGSNPDNLGNMERKLRSTNNEKGNGFNGNIDLKYEVLKGLTVMARVGGNIGNTFIKQHDPKFELVDLNGDPVNGGTEFATLKNRQTYFQKWIAEFTATYQKKFGEHSVTGLVGYSKEQSQYNWFEASKNKFLSNDIQVLGGGAEVKSADGRNTTSSITGLFGRVLYNYKSKYLLSAVLRHDGSSRFGSNNRYADFPSVSAGWVISEEPYFRNSGIGGVIELFKIRAGYGTAGNQRIGDYRYDVFVANNIDYILGRGDQQVINGAIQTNYGNPDLQWETTIQRNIGTDINFFGGRMDFSFDYYHTNKENMLLDVIFAPSAGNSGQSVPFNVGNMYNKGIEIALGYKKSFGDFNFSISGVFTRNRNEVTKLSNPDDQITGGIPLVERAGKSEPTTFVKQGYPAGSFFLIPTDGVIKTEEELSAYQNVVSDARIGDLRYVDVNNDSTISDDDRIYMGSGMPSWEAGLNLNASYKGLDFSLQLYGTYGNKIYNGPKLWAYSTKRHQDLVYAWSPENPTSDIPTPRPVIEHNNTRSLSDYFIEDGSYLRVRNVQLGYALPDNLLEKIHVERFRIYVAAQNPLTFTKYEGFDPEVGNDGLFYRGVDRANYPVSAQYRMGIQLGF
ncbi:SusC/RagA family TonB-linked outer membrane protein [Flexithrix dorotheae]|uniref:SusC/RagA family TonB-linked outer membrane protein n=1 Tax=Flexithrix dorotheae TaxID=70993 RepID=UPI0004779B7F|nr:TonB-dependent receptor [Flexithrix dorotheae]